MNDVEEFLARQQRYVCERLAANLTVEQCESNRNRQANINRVMQCEGCKGLGKAIEIKERVMATEKICLECGKLKKIHGYGHCAKCLYAKYGKAMKPPKADPAPLAPAKDPEPAKAAIETALPETVLFDRPCAACGKKIEGEICSDECPFCMANPVTGELFKLPESSPLQIKKTVTPSSNPLLPAAIECEVVLNFDGNKPLYDWLQEHEVTPDHIIELLDMAYTRGLRPA